MDFAIRFRMRFEVAEYLEIDDASDERHEFSDGVILAMPDEAYDALPIVRAMDAALNVSQHIRDRLGNPDADRLMVDPTVRDGHLAQPLLYGPPLDPTATRVWRSIPNRTFIVELPAGFESNASAQLAIYREAAGLRDYMLVSQREPRITTWIFDGDGCYARRTFDQLDAIVPIASLAICVSARRVYELDPIVMRSLNA